ncbi:MAG: TonB family protein [Myxococcales bacterium]|nr:TonB family protein [Myxococcales bacterium]
MLRSCGRFVVGIVTICSLYACSASRKATPVVPAPTPTPPKTGPLTPDEITGALVANRSKFRSCYDVQRARHPSLEGTIVVRFSIAPMGLVTSAQVTSSSMKNADVEQCVLRELFGLRFRRGGPTATVVNHPFRFTAR